MPMSRELLKEVRRLDEFDLRRLMIIVRGLLIEQGGALVEEKPPGVGAVTYRQQHVKCSKTECSRCPHGPYWYAYWRENGKQRSRYVGKTLPESAAQT
jgi:hypothetical protein